MCSDRALSSGAPVPAPGSGVHGAMGAPARPMTPNNRWHGKCDLQRDSHDQLPRQMKVVCVPEVRADVRHNQVPGDKVTECGRRSLVGPAAHRCMYRVHRRAATPTTATRYHTERNAPGGRQPPRPWVASPREYLLVGAVCSENCMHGARARPGTNPTFVE